MLPSALPPTTSSDYASAPASSLTSLTSSLHSLSPAPAAPVRLNFDSPRSSASPRPHRCSHRIVFVLASLKLVINLLHLPPRLHRRSHQPIDTPQFDALFPASVRTNPALFPRADRYTLLRTLSARAGSGLLGSLRFATTHRTTALWAVKRRHMSPRAPIRFGFPLESVSARTGTSSIRPRLARGRQTAAAPPSPPTITATDTDVSRIATTVMARTREYCAQLETGCARIFKSAVKMVVDVDGMETEVGTRMKTEMEADWHSRASGSTSMEARLSKEMEMARTSEIELKPGCGCAYILPTPALSSSPSLPRSRLWLPRLPLYSPLFSSSSMGFALPRYVHASARDVEAW
ncbi:hypothetical protein B0H13DRAFT_2674500 [Mycena leptocephala]|nr:hypothetical protein B0H13DRAFT_2674500 [Mycena leptocephala]